MGLLDLLSVAVAAALGCAGWFELRRRKRQFEQRANELAEQRERLRSVLDQGRELISRFLPDSELTYVNAAYCAHFRRVEDELIGRRWLELVPKAYFAEVQDRLRRLRPARPSTTSEHVLLAPNGEQTWMRWTHHAFFDETGKPIEFQSFGWDITSRRRAEEERLSAEKRLTDIISAAGEYVWEVDLDTRWISLSDRAEEVFAQSRMQLLGQRLFDFMPEPAASGMQQWFRDQQLRRRSFRNMEYPHRRTDGTVRWVRISGEPVFDGNGALVGFRGTGLDITEERNGISALRESKQQLDLAISAASLGIWDYDLLSGELVWNRRWADVLGVPRSSHVPTLDDWFEHVYSEDRDEVARLFQAHLDGKNAVFEAEYRVRSGDGEIIWVLDRGTVVERTVNGRSVRAIGMVQDITAQRESETELRRAKDEADRANMAKSEFLADMSHEIRTPMTAILGYMELLDESGEDGDPKRRADAVVSIRRNGDHLLQLINDILDLSKIEAEKFSIEDRRCSPLEIVQEIFTRMQVRSAEKGLKMQLEPIYPLPAELQSDPTRLRQILVNLVGNAVKFTESGSVHIRVEFEATPVRRFIVEVADTGVGIEQDQLDAIFDPFAQADTSMSRRFGGTGLGLGISRRLAMMLGGDISVESTPDEGSRFRLHLNLDEGPLKLLAAPAEVEGEPAPALPAPTAAKAAAGTIKGRILLAEYGPDNQRQISFFLRKAGAEVEIAGNGAIAIEKLLAALETDEPFDMVLLDMQMPEFDGYGAATKLREMGITTPIIALTAHARSGDRERCIDAGCDDYTTKPVNRPLLAELCTRWIEIGDERRAAA